MYCSKCGALLEKNNNFCSACGNKVLENNQLNNNNLNSNVQTVNQQNKFNNSTVNYSQGNQVKKVNTSNSKKTSVSMIIGIISIILCFIFNILIVPVALVGLIIGITEKNKSGKVAGIILNLFAIVIPIVIIVLAFFCFSELFKKFENYTNDKIFEGDG